ncbi:hypothetical protein GCM10011390_00680 [Aureimonas endophytica]|uniref:Uncharacterized protein n=1 Tax=Aureimonas endophytica TaxID=2027858 RepID=A0A916ZBC7_9HYPH|nr:DUF6163 family protein [Aureimonas endophytica]GGD85980.1 hypothetical protein GCM10011390_00680 [Aureimonas endophytica]
MTTSPATNERTERIVRWAILLLLRAAGLALFGLGLFYWIMLVGVFPESGWRFDLMPLEWRVAAAALAVLCPVAGVGLWLTASWGSVVWLLVAALEGAMHVPLQRQFGGPGPELAFHCAGLLALGLLRIVEWHLGRTRRR